MTENSPRLVPPLRLLITSSVTRHPKRALLQSVIAFLVVLSGWGSLTAGSSGGASIVSAVEASGADRYAVSAIDTITGSNVPVDDDVLTALARADGINFVRASGAFSAAIEQPGLADEVVNFVALDSSFVQAQEIVAVAGWLPVPERSLDFGLLVGEQTAARLGITSACVQNQQCSLTVRGHEILVSAIVTSRSQPIGDAAFISLDRAAELGFIPGPTSVEVSASGLPGTSVRRSLDLIASSASSQRVIVTAPESASSLREGVNDAWRRTIAGMSLLILGLGVAAQVAVQRSAVRNRFMEIATLRSLGYPPKFVILQFTVEPLILAFIGVAASSAAGLVVLAALPRLTPFRVDIPVAASLSVCVSVMLISAASSLLAANKAAQISPAEAVRQE